jgi:predicted dehydrogenase
MVKVGQIGMGFMGRTHFGIYEKLPNARVVAFADQDPKRRAGTWADPIGNMPADWPAQVDMSGRRSYANLDDMLEDPEIDLVDITLPTYLHADAVVKALKAGKHVLSEKPMGLTSAECKKVLDAYKKAKTNYMVAQCIRFWPQYVAIKEMITSKKFGKLRSLALKRLANPPMYSMGNWLMDHKKSGGALLDLHVHDIDFAAHMLGKPKRIYAKATKGPSGGWDHVEAIWDYDKDLLVTVEGGWAFAPSWPFDMVLIARCEKATVKWVMSEGPNVKVFGESGVEEIAVENATGWDKEIAYFVDCVASGKKPKMCTPDSTALSIALADAEVKSITTGKVVAIK